MRISTLVGWAAILLFAVICAVELLPHHGRPVTLPFIEGSFGHMGATYQFLTSSAPM